MQIHSKPLKVSPMEIVWICSKVVNVQFCRLGNSLMIIKIQMIRPWAPIENFSGVGVGGAKVLYQGCIAKNGGDYTLQAKRRRRRDRHAEGVAIETESVQGDRMGREFPLSSRLGG